ncbi:MAG: Gfo/Idh/MocA family oxidoreductase [Acidobacteriota bacterium]|nr:Gfo/Idh/MocA family oxidoreductase [Acidobacteriota bacterium]
MQRRDFVKASMLAGLAAPLISNAQTNNSQRTVRVGLVGVGQRGLQLLGALLKSDNVEVKAICDVDDNHQMRGMKLFTDAGKEKPAGYSKGPEDYKRLVERNDLDAVITATPWELHVPVMLATLDAGKYGATEVPAAVTVDECWALVEKSEKTGIPCMMLENSCFGRASLAVFNLVRAGLLGEIYHVESGYNHDVRYVKFDVLKNHGYKDEGKLRWRGEHSVKRDGNLYPTHQLGPAALLMDIDRGTRMKHLVSMSTPQHGMTNYIIERFGKDHPMAKQKFKNGDVNCTLIKLENGNTLTQYHDTQSWRPRDDIHRYHGTKGAIARTQGKIFTIDEHWDRKTEINEWKWRELAPYLKKYDHALWQKHGEEAAKHAHGGSDWMTLHAFIQAVRNKTQTPLTVYDAASWSVVAPLSEKSVANDSERVDFPDFTRGKWKTTPKFEMSVT